MKKFCLLVVMLCAVIFSSSASAANWIAVGEDEFGMRYYDSESIARDANQAGSVFHAIIRTDLSDNGHRFFVDQLSARGNAPEEIQTATSILFLQYYKYDSGVKYCATAAINFYDADGKLLKEYSNNQLTWDRVAPDSLEEDSFDKIAAHVTN